MLKRVLTAAAAAAALSLAFFVLAQPATAEVVDPMQVRSASPSTPAMQEESGWSGILARAPKRPTISLAGSSDTGPSGSDGYTRDTTPTITGRAGRGSTVVITQNRRIVAQGTVAASGSYQIKLPKLRDGVYRFEAAEVVRPGVGIFSDAEIKITIDTRAPAPPVVNQPPQLIDKWVTIRGTADDAGEITIYFDGKPRYQANSYGAGRGWGTSIDSETGIYTIYTRLTDLAGNNSILSNSVTLIVSRRVPKLDLVAGGVANFDLMGTNENGLFGYDVSAGGDFNGDQLADILIGAPISDRAKQSESGSAFLLLGQPGKSKFSEFPLPYDHPRYSLHILGAPAARTLGAAVSTAGDMNGDGLSEILVGEPNLRGGNAYVVFGHRENPGVIDVSQLDGKNGFRLKGDADRPVGGALSGGGDVNGDGYDDIVIAPGDQGRLNGRQQVFVIFGRKDSFPPLIDLASLDPRDGIKIVGNGAYFGFSVANSSDLNDDGLAEIVVTSPAFSESDGRRAGAAFVVYGRKRFDDTVNTRTLEPSDGFQILGYGHSAGIASSIGAVSTGGDVNGDKVDDLFCPRHFWASTHAKALAT